MSALMTHQAVAIDLSADHASSHCQEMSWQLHQQLSNGYTRGASILALPEDFGGYVAARRTARKRATRAARLGYRFTEIERRNHEADIFAINTSAPIRQGRPMSDGYLREQHFSPNPLVCGQHHVYTYGVVSAGRLVAYLWLYRCGELAMISSILGHADHLADDVMYLLVTETIREQIPLGGTLFYNLHSSGTDGLRFFKERLGLTSAEVAWLR